MSEFDLIRRHFTRATPHTLLGVGDDCALLEVSAGNVLAVSTDMLVSGTHFFADDYPYSLGHKTLAVNLSDLAAMGATPRWATLAISLPSADDAWLERFSAGFFSLAKKYNVDLVGGDTTRGPLNLCVTIMGEVPPHQALRRDGAQPGDDVWVSGKLGDAALALAHLQGKVRLSDADFAACSPALHQPQPRVALGLALRGIAHSAIDISDGLVADLGHILDASKVGARLEFASVPVSDILKARLTPLNLSLSGGAQSAPPLTRRGREGLDATALFQHCALSGGDDYELCFTAAGNHRDEILRIAEHLALPLTCIGKIVAGKGCVVHDARGAIIHLESGGYDHF